VKRIALAFGAVLAGALPADHADARRVVHMPTIAELCPGNAEWQKVAECLKRQSPFKLVRDEARVKVVDIPGTSRFAGIYVYGHGKQWQLRGELRVYEEHELLRFERVTLGNHAGYRLDAGIAVATSYSLDGETSIPAVLRQTQTLVCFEDAGCSQVMTSCDLLVHGKALYSFRGKLAYMKKQLQVVGDRKNAGGYCQQPELVLDDQ
jgi:hypothetical protein